MTGAEQFEIFNTGPWLTAFRVQVNNVQTALANLGTTVDQLTFSVQGIPCAVQLLSDTQAMVHVGTDDSGNWQYTLKVPVGWFQPPQ